VREEPSVEEREGREIRMERREKERERETVFVRVCIRNVEQSSALSSVSEEEEL
jgi:hypothetical protein